MGKVAEFLKKLAALPRRRRLDRDLDEEMRIHREMRAIESGLPPDEAYYAALGSLGPEQTILAGREG
jgi:hypothetical protein